MDTDIIKYIGEEKGWKTSQLVIDFVNNLINESKSIILFEPDITFINVKDENGIIELFWYKRKKVEFMVSIYGDGTIYWDVTSQLKNYYHKEGYINKECLDEILTDLKSLRLFIR